MNFEPLKQTNLFGHKDCLNGLISLYKQNQLPNKILFSGVKGIGKCTTAYHLINYILSSNEDFSYDVINFNINTENKSFKLTLNKSNPNFYLIDVAENKKNIDINQIRNLIINLNKSSFNTKPRFVLIDNIELLNINSVNALLKTLEEPNDNINFILINNNKNILPTIKSRCLNFKFKLTYVESIEIVNNILNENINNLLNNEIINNYSTPGQLLRIINFSNENDIDFKNTSLKNLLSLIINEKHYRKETSIKDLTYSLIELYFRNNISIKNIKLIDMYSYFLKKIDNTKKYNLDNETLFMEFDDRILNG
jgi:DNA polymerase-3 subunit delta'